MGKEFQVAKWDLLLFGWNKAPGSFLIAEVLFGKRGVFLYKWDNQGFAAIQNQCGLGLGV